MSDVFSAMTVSALGMKAQGTRLRVIAENIANAETYANTPAEDPYRRQIITFRNEMDREMGAQLVRVDSIRPDQKDPFVLKYMPDHPGADAKGYVKTPNVNTLIELADMREAQRSYEANLGMIEQARGMMLRVIDVLR
jgi:flagellar basal-body rod protein FlgC